MAFKAKIGYHLPEGVFNAGSLIPEHLVKEHKLTNVVEVPDPVVQEAAPVLDQSEEIENLKAELAAVKIALESAAANAPTETAPEAPKSPEAPAETGGDGVESAAAAAEAKSTKKPASKK